MLRALVNPFWALDRSSEGHKGSEEEADTMHGSLTGISGVLNSTMFILVQVKGNPLLSNIPWAGEMGSLSQGDVDGRNQTKLYSSAVFSSSQRPVPVGGCQREGDVTGIL